MKRLIPLLAIAVGCGSETQINSALPQWGDPNPADYEPPVQEDRIRQVVQPEVDILWLVDDSHSMKDDAQKLQENFPVFFDTFEGSGLDYHIGVISTNTTAPAESGKLLEAQGYRWVDPETPDAHDVFAEMVPISSGLMSHEESGREAVWRSIAIEGTVTNAGFFREESALHIVAISDENDHSKSPPLDEFVPWLEGLKPLDEQLSFNSIVGLQVPCNGSFEKGEDYIAVTEEVGGFLFSICELDWSTTMDNLSLKAAGLRKEYFLSKLPVIDTIDVEVELTDGTVMPFDDGWSYVPGRNSILFDEYVPDPLAIVVIRYTVLAATEGDDRE